MQINTPLDKLIAFSLDKKLVVTLLIIGVILWGIVVAPFDWNRGFLPSNPVPVDAIPDIGENQQIVYTSWDGRSPQDIEDQITYPLTVTLMGLPGVKTVRSYSYFGFSSIYVIFEDDIEFYWSRTRILEKLNSLAAGTLPTDVSPILGPDATALGQVFWYTLEGVNLTPQSPLLESEGRIINSSLPLQGEGLGMNGEWDLDELRSTNDFYVRYALQSVPGVAEVAPIGGMVKEYQVDVNPERLRHFGVSLNEVYRAVAQSNQDVGARTIEINRVEYLVRAKGYIKTIEDLELAVITTRDGTPIYISDVATVILGPAPRRGALDKSGVDVVGGVVVARYGENPLEVIQAVKQKLTEIAPGLPEQQLADGSISKVTIVPFYDRSGLIKETLATLNKALTEEVLVTVIVILVLLGHFRSSLVISSLLPAAVLGTFIVMKQGGVDANVVALSGIAIAIGTMVDMGIILSENIVRHLDESDGSVSKKEIIFIATKEVASAIITAVSTTVISFIPVFVMTGAEGKLFKPLAFTKTFALGSSLALALFVLPPVALVLFKKVSSYSGKKPWGKWITILFALLFLTYSWMPLGLEYHYILNFLFVLVLLGGVLWLVWGFITLYPVILTWTLNHRLLFLTLPLLLLITAGVVMKRTGSEFMPSLDEGSFLLMPTTMPHASFEEVQDQLSIIDRLLEQIPEVEMAVGKLGRAESSLDPAPPSMYEVVINYKNEYGVDSTGKRVRQWRDEIHSSHDIWQEIVRVVKIPGLTSAPKLQPIETRLVMLQSGMRAPMGIKIKGPDLETIERFGLQLEQLLKQAPSISPATVIADRIVGKPYLEYTIDRQKAARYGLTIAAIENTIMTALGGRVANYTVEGRERYAVRVRYQRERRDNIEALTDLLITPPNGNAIPISELASIEFTRGPMVIKGEDGFLVGYVVFDKIGGTAETSVVLETQEYLDHLIKSGELTVPSGVSYTFTGNYENQVRSQKTLAIVIPVALSIIFLILYLQFSDVPVTLIIFSGIAVAWAGGFLFIGLYNSDWFMNFTLLGIDFRDLFQIRTVNFSVAVAVGFIALFGIASDNGVVISEYMKQQFKKNQPKSKAEIRELTLIAGTRRIRPCMMTTATTLLALLPVLTSSGRGSDIMLPMSIPAFGGMAVAILTVFVVPVLYSWVEEIRVARGKRLE